MTRWMILLVFTVLLGPGCDSGGGSGDSGDAGAAAQAGNSAQIFSDNVADFSVHVVYEAGAEPYTGYIGVTNNQVWDITQQSFHALFQNHVGRFVTVPTALGQMTGIANQNKTNWTAPELIELGRKHALSLADGQDVRVTVIFLNGIYNDDGGIMGVHFAGSPFAFVFKDVVLSLGGDPVSQRYAEQATVVHELGHAVGLVNNGVPMNQPHEDPQHPKHAIDSGCVMYWAIESKGNILTLLGAAILGNELNLFGPASIDDARNYHP